MSQEFNENDCTIGLSKTGTHAIITIPIRKYALDHFNGNALIFGKLKELELHLLGMAEQIRNRQQLNGVIKVNGTPPDLKVN